MVDRNVYKGFLPPGLSESDILACFESLKKLRRYVAGKDRSLVFFVGAGASFAGHTGMPQTPALLYDLLCQALFRPATQSRDEDKMRGVLKEITADSIGFEITLNDFWQICRQATTLLYDAFGALDKLCSPNRVHAFLAYWLSTGGTVITTNYDRLIEREWRQSGHAVRTRYREEGTNSFRTWRDDLKRGGHLFKIHGSLTDSGSCLGALEHVGTQLTGHRAELLHEVIRTRPVCFVGWSGKDPDIPLLLHSSLADRDPSLPAFWMHYEGPGSLARALERCADSIKPYAKNRPILTEADRAFGRLLDWVGIPSAANLPRGPRNFNFDRALKQCSESGLTRMVGIALRRSGRFAEAESVLKLALKRNPTPGETSAAFQEISLLYQQKSGRQTHQALKWLEEARMALNQAPDLHLQLNLDFGLLSMSTVGLESQPWLISKIPGYFRRYRQDIERLRQEATDEKSLALHESLIDLYSGRLRFKVVGWLATVLIPLRDWILHPYQRAYSTVANAKDISVHSRIDVMAYRAIALAHMGRCEDARHQVPEIDRLIAIFQDQARTEHWEKQKQEILDHCEV